MGTYAQGRAIARIAGLVDQGLDAVTFWREASEPLARAVPHDAAPCWWTLDPASLLMTSHYNPLFPEVPPAWLEIEYLDDEGGKLTDVARSRPGSRRSTR